jgi:hypothetical protein
MSAMPMRQAVHEWIADNRPGFSDRYARARELQADCYADKIVEVQVGRTWKDPK